MNAEQKWTPEPWSADDFVVTPGDGSGSWFLYEAGEDDGPIAEFYGPNAGANADRAANCVSSCAGIPNPAAYISQLKADLRTLAAEVNAVRLAQASCDCDTCGKRGPAYLARLNTDISNALARAKEIP